MRRRLAGSVLIAVGSLGILFTSYNLVQVLVYPELYYGMVWTRLALISLLLLAAGAGVIFAGFRLTKRVSSKLGE